MNKKISKYNIVQNADYGALATTINQRISEGWQPFGSLSSVAVVKEGVQPTKLATLFSQAIVLYTE